MKADPTSARKLAMNAVESWRQDSQSLEDTLPNKQEAQRDGNLYSGPAVYRPHMTVRADPEWAQVTITFLKVAAGDWQIISKRDESYYSRCRQPGAWQRLHQNRLYDFQILLWTPDRRWTFKCRK